MTFKAGHLAAMEEAGLMDTSEGLISRVAKKLNNSPNDVIENDEFIEACERCGMDPYSFTESDLARLQEKLK